MGFERSDSAVAVLGMEGFVLLAAVEVDGELYQLVETEASVVGCSGCGTGALSKGRRRTKVRELSSARMEAGLVAGDPRDDSTR